MQLNHARTTFQAMVVSQEEAEGGAAKVDASLIHTVESRLKSNMETLIHQSKKDCEESMAKRQAHWKGELEEVCRVCVAVFFSSPLPLLWVVCMWVHAVTSSPHV